MTRITQEQYDRIKDVFPVQRGNVRVSNVDFLNAIFHITESGCRWRQLPKEFGDWHTIYVHMQRWADKGVWPRVQEALRSKLGINLNVAVILRGGPAVEECPKGATSPDDATLVSSVKYTATKIGERPTVTFGTTSEPFQTADVHVKSMHRNDTLVE